MRGIDIGNTVFITAVIAVNEARLKEEPPASVVSNESAAVGVNDISHEILRKARRYDYYNDIAVLSMRTSGQCCHMVNTAVVPIVNITGIMPYTDERTILQELWERNCLTGQTVAGWKLDEFMPTLVYKGVWYGLSVEDRFKMDPASSAYPVIPGVLHVETIYQQSVRDSNRRPVPVFEDLCQHWNIPVPNRAHCMTRYDLSKLTIQNWIDYGFKSIENTLFAQEYLVRAYYGYK